MKTSNYLYILLILFISCNSAPANLESKESKEIPRESASLSELYELRTYYAADGKLDDLLNRFRNHTISLFEKHGMTNVAYWIPTENTENTLVYLLKYTSREAREKSWKSFREDPEWQEAYKNSREAGALVDSVKNLFLHPTDFSPVLEIEDLGSRVFEMRTYYTNDGKLTDLHTRFRDHTMAIFERNGMSNIAYFTLEDDQPESDHVLLYFISHPDILEARKNWESFGKDPEWQEVYAASIANGKLVDHLTSRYLFPVDFSPLK